MFVSPPLLTLIAVVGVLVFGGPGAVLELI